MDKKTLRKAIFQKMCFWAEDHSRNLYVHYPEDIKDPLDFKPGVSDKLIFSRILDLNLDTIYREYNEEITSKSFVAYNLLMNYYYPNFGWWDRLELEKARF